MTEPTKSERPDDTNPDETFTWTGDAGTEEGATGASGTHGSGAGSPAATATAILESVRDAVDDLAERASPAVREISARAAELAASAADRAAPFAKRAGEVTADASGKLATKSRVWAADLRASLAASDTGVHGPTPADPTTPPAPQTATDAEATSTEESRPA